jgi:hypothetical protein
VAHDIDSYLRELQAALRSAGADPALVQDALFDAEEYMQAEMAAGGEFATVAEGYGSPEEVAAAYLGVPASATVPTAAETQIEAETEGTAVRETPAVETVPAVEAVPAVQAVPVGEAVPAGEAASVSEDIASKAAAVASGAATGMAEVSPVTPAPPAPPVPPVIPVAPTAPTPPVAPLPTGVQAGLAAAGAATAVGAEAPPSVWRQIFGVFVDPAVYKALAYMIIALGTGIAYFTIVVTGVSTSAGMLVLIIGIPLFVGVLGIVRAMSLFEGRVVELFLGTRMPRRPRAEPPNAGFFQRMWFWVKDGRTWLSMLYMVLMLPLGIIYFTIAVTGLAVGLSLITTPLWAWAGWLGNRTFEWEGVTYDWWFPVWGIPAAVIVGALVLIAFMHIVKWIGRGHAAFAKAMLVRLAK